MKSIKIAIAVGVALAAISLVPLAQADTGYKSLLAGTETVPASASNNTAVVIKTESAKVGLQWSFKLTGAGTSGVLFQSEVSLDNSTFATGPHSVWVAGNGTTAVTGITNFDFGPYPFVRFKIHNTNSVVVTNWAFKAWSVPGI
jgi:hypothetical protein